MTVLSAVKRLCERKQAGRAKDQSSYSGIGMSLAAKMVSNS